MEGRCFFVGTFHARGCLYGRLALFRGDLPCQGLFIWKVGAFSWGPSMPEAVYMEGPAFFMGTLHAGG